MVTKDISEKKKLEISLKDSEAKYRDLFENAQDAMYTLDMNGTFLAMNNVGIDALGATKDEIIGSNLSEWLTPESMEIARKRLKEYSNGIHKGPMVYEMVRKDGEHIWVEVKNRFIRDGERITGTHGIARDITEKIRLEHQLKESEARYRDLFENADYPMYTIDMNGIFQSINNAGCRILEAGKEKIIGTHIVNWLTPESLESAKQRIKKHLSSVSIEEPVIYELVCNNGEHRWAEIRTRPIKEGNRITGIHGIGRDITEKIKLEQKLKDYRVKLERSYEELLEADNVKTEFISNITHELLTPLTSIRGFVELLDDETMGKVNVEQKKSLEIILRNSDRLIKLIKELLDTSNLESNKLGLQFGIVSLNSILSKTIQDIHPQANDKQITIIKDIQQLPEIWGDEERLLQVIMNLLINAIKFTPHTGKITIKAKEDSEHVKISISDTGIGIPADKLNSIFERFYQVDGSAKRKYGGAGLGLSI
ncbi:partial two-component system, OmpR family, sensor histidine kinase VicK, partial [Methanosarcinales archaeon]